MSDGSDVDEAGDADGPCVDTASAAHSNGDSRAPELSAGLLESLQSAHGPLMQQLGSFLSTSPVKTADLCKRFEPREPGLAFSQVTKIAKSHKNCVFRR